MDIEQKECQKEGNRKKKKENDKEKRLLRSVEVELFKRQVTDKFRFKNMRKDMNMEKHNHGQGDEQVHGVEWSE